LIEPFARHVGRSSWSVLQLVLTPPAAMWAVRMLRTGHQPFGASVGLLVASTAFVRGFTLGPRVIVWSMLTIGAGWIGGAVAQYSNRAR
jgi:hypothetical protein